MSTSSNQFRTATIKRQSTNMTSQQISINFDQTSISTITHQMLANRHQSSTVFAAASDILRLNNLCVCASNFCVIAEISILTSIAEANQSIYYACRTQSLRFPPWNYCTKPTIGQGLCLHLHRNYAAQVVWACRPCLCCPRNCSLLDLPYQEFAATAVRLQNNPMLQ